MDIHSPDLASSSVIDDADRLHESQKITVGNSLTIYDVAVLITKVRLQLLDAMSCRRAIELDMAEVRELDGAGLQFLLATARSAEAFKVTVVLSGLSPTVMALLRQYGVAGNFSIPSEIDPENVPTSNSAEFAS